MRELLDFCESAQQRKLIETLIKCHGNVSAVCREMEIHERNVRRAIQKIRARAAQAGISPDHDMTHGVPPGYHVKGVSTLYDSDGKVSAQWVKSELSKSELRQALADAMQETVEAYKGTAKPVKAPKRNVDEVMVVYPLGDPHIGMYAWSAECGEDFDTQIARTDLMSAVSRLVEVSPPSERAAIINLGDFFHADNLKNATFRNQNSLDVDTRWPRVLKVGCMLMVDLIEVALAKHKQVDVINSIGNHDDHSSIMLAAFLEAFFHSEPRVNIWPTVSKFHYLEFGRNLIGVTHGDTIKLTELASLMASDQPDAWGRTEHRYWYTGHIHHTSKTELRGCVVESFRTLAAKDAWHTAQGYRSGRDMYSIVLDKQYGEIERYRCDIRLARRDRGDG